MAPVAEIHEFPLRREWNIPLGVPHHHGTYYMAFARGKSRGQIFSYFMGSPINRTNPYDGHMTQYHGAQDGMFHVTTNVRGKVPWLTFPGAPEIIIDNLIMTKHLHQARLYAFCILPDHM